MQKTCLGERVWTEEGGEKEQAGVRLSDNSVVRSMSGGCAA